MGRRARNFAWRFISAGSVAICMAGCSALPEPGAAVLTGAAAPMPQGFVDFCRRDPEGCGRPAEGPDRLSLTPALWAELQHVNRSLNAAIQPVEDAGLYGVEEYWTPAATAGDCEDYVLAKREALLTRGWPATALRISVVHSDWTGRHAVLVVSTDHGDLVLDNTVMPIRTVEQTGYQWLTIQDPGEPLSWRLIVAQSSDVPAPRLLAANRPRLRSTWGPGGATAGSSVSVVTDVSAAQAPFNSSEARLNSGVNAE